MNSNAGFDSVADDERLIVSFGVKSSGATNVKDYLDSTKCKNNFINCLPELG